MAAISISIAKGKDGFRINDFTVGVLAPGANDFELRFNTTDGLGAPIRMKDVLIALEAFERAITTTDSNVNIISIPTL